MQSKLSRLISLLAETRPSAAANSIQRPIVLVNAIQRLCSPEIMVNNLGTDFQSGEGNAQIRLQMALEAVRLGGDQERVTRYLSWKEFEDFTAYVLASNCFQTFKNARIGFGRKKTEIDIVGVKPPIVLCVDCKHWSYGWNRSRLAKAAARQMIRCQRLISVGSELLDGFEGDAIRVASILVTLADVSIRNLNGVAVVPILRLQSFLDELSPYSPVLKWLRPESSMESLPSK